MKNILVPVGSSKNAESHLQYAVDFAKAFGAKLYFVQIYNVYTKAGTMIRVDDIIEHQSKEFLDGLIAKIDTKGVEIVTRTIKGKLIDVLELAFIKTNIDLILIEPRTNSVKDQVYLGKTSGKIIKQTTIPALIIPEAYVFKPFKNILLALKSAIIKKEGVLEPLKNITQHFKSKVNLLLVKTPYHIPEDFIVNAELESLIDKTTISENLTTFFSVLEHFQSNNPDLLCVVRRKRGFFAKKWEKNTILKKDFFSKIPVLVLRGLK